MGKGKDPAVLWYPDEWLGGTRLMTFAHMGAYMECLMVQYKNGHLSLDQIRHVLHGDLHLWETGVKEKFITDDNGLFYNKKMDDVIAERRAYKEGRLANLRGKNAPHMETPYGDPICRNRNRDINNSKDKDKYLEYVYLTKGEYAKLVDKIGEAETTAMIDRLNNYIGSKGKKYKSHYHTILAWVEKDKKDKPKNIWAVNKINYREGL